LFFNGMSTPEDTREPFSIAVVVTRLLTGFLSELPPVIFFYSFVLGGANLAFLALPPAVVFPGESSPATLDLSWAFGFRFLRTANMYSPWRLGGIHTVSHDNLRGDDDVKWLTHVMQMVDVAAIVVMDLRAGMSPYVREELSEILRTGRRQKTIVLCHPFEHATLGMVLSQLRVRVVYDEADVCYLVRQATTSRNALWTFYQECFPR